MINFAIAIFIFISSNGQLSGDFSAEVKLRTLLLASSHLVSSSILYQLILFASGCPSTKMIEKGRETVLEVKCKDSASLIRKMNGKIKKFGSSLILDFEVEKLGFLGVGYFKIQGNAELKSAGFEIKKVKISRISQLLFFKREKEKLEIENLVISSSGDMKNFRLSSLPNSGTGFRFGKGFILLENFVADISMLDKGIRTRFQRAKIKSLFKNQSVELQISDCFFDLGTEFSTSCLGSNEMENLDLLSLFFLIRGDIITLW